jgi:nucleotide-binding universal stress UspA family protein
VIESILIAVDAAPFADRVGPWIPDIVGAGVRRATLFHAIEETGEACARELDELRPRLDRLAVQLSARDVEADIALKRGDRVKWLVSLAELRTTQLLVVGARCSKEERGASIGTTLRLLLEQSHVPLLVLNGVRVGAQPRLFERPFLIAGRRPDSRVETRAKALIPATLHPVNSVPSDPSSASLLVTGPEPAGMTFEQLIAQAACPVLAFPSPSLVDHAPGSPNTVIPPTEATGAMPNPGGAR